MWLELPSQRNFLAHFVPKLRMLKQGKIPFGIGQKQLSPKSYLQRKQESRYYEYWTENSKHCLELASLR